MLRCLLDSAVTERVQVLKHFGVVLVDPLLSKDKKIGRQLARYQSKCVEILCAFASVESDRFFSVC